MAEPATTLIPASESESDASSAYRLVIRVKFAREEASPAPVHPRFNVRALLLIAVVAVAALSWLGISILRSRPTPERPVAQAPVTVAPKVEPAPAETPMPAATPSPSTNEVIPKVSQSARESIRGTIRVSVRMIVDREGKVVASATDDPGPSRYFTRLALEASKKWTFAPSDSKTRRIALVRFNFTRDATTADLTSLQ